MAVQAMLQHHDLQLDRVFRHMCADFVLERTIAVEGSNAIDVRLVGFGDAEGRAEVLLGQRKSLCTVGGGPV